MSDVIDLMMLLKASALSIKIALGFGFCFLRSQSLIPANAVLFWTVFPISKNAGCNREWGYPRLPHIYISLNHLSKSLTKKGVIVVWMAFSRETVPTHHQVIGIWLRALLEVKSSPAGEWGRLFLDQVAYWLSSCHSPLCYSELFHSIEFHLRLIFQNLKFGLLEEFLVSFPLLGVVCRLFSIGIIRSWARNLWKCISFGSVCIFS